MTTLGSVSVTGYVSGPPVLSTDGTRAVITTDVPTSTGTTTRVAVVNTTTGKQVGTTLTLPGSPGSAVFSADGTRTLINTVSKLAVINTITGTQAGTTVTGGNYPLLAPDGTRALIITGSDPTRVTVLQIA